MAVLDPFLERTRIAYLSMEIALRPEMHTYSGGLGILAGDVARTCADLELPVVLVTLVSRQGYLRQEIDAAGRQVDHPDPWTPADWAVPLPAMVAIELEGRPVWIRAWLHVVDSPVERDVPVILLDTDMEQNHPDDRGITNALFRVGARERGVGGAYGGGSLAGEPERDTQFRLVFAAPDVLAQGVGNVPERDGRCRRDQRLAGAALGDGLAALGLQAPDLGVQPPGALDGVAQGLRHRRRGDQDGGDGDAPQQRRHHGGGCSQAPVAPGVGPCASCPPKRGIQPGVVAA